MAKVRKFKRIPSDLDWAKFYDAQYRTSPRYKEQMARIGVKAKLDAERFALPLERAERRDRLEDYEAKLKIKAEFDAGQSELRYSQKQKREIDRWRMVPQLARQSGIFNKDQLNMIDQKVMLSILGYTPTEQFKLTKFPKGQGFGESWDKKDGSTVSRDDKGNEKLMQRFDQGREAQSMKEEQDSIKAQAVIQAGIDKEKRAYERELNTKGVMEGGFERPRTAGEIRQALSVYGRSNEINEAKDLVNKVDRRYGSSIEEIPEELLQRYFNAVDLLKETGTKRDASIVDADMPTVNNDSDYKKLPSGAEFIDPNGKRRRKP